MTQAWGLEGVGAAPEVVEGSGVDLLAEHVADGRIGKHVRVQEGQAEGQQPARGPRSASGAPCKPLPELRAHLRAAEPSRQGCGSGRWSPVSDYCTLMPYERFFKPSLLLGGKHVCDSAPRPEAVVPRTANHSLRYHHLR